MAEAYLAFLLGRCSIASGRVFVGEIDRAIVGFIGVLPSVAPEEPDEDRAPYAYIKDLLVLPTTAVSASAARCSITRSDSPGTPAPAFFASACWRRTRSRVRSTAR